MANRPFGTAHAGSGSISGAIDYLETYQWLVVPLTAIYFVAATLWMKNRREVRTAIAQRIDTVSRIQDWYR
jgi:hypothetical protein